MRIFRLNESGVDTRHVRVDPGLKTGLGIALCTEDDRAILTYGESSAALEPGDVDETLWRSDEHREYVYLARDRGPAGHLARDADLL